MMALQGAATEFGPYILVCLLNAHKKYQAKTWDLSEIQSESQNLFLLLVCA